MKRIFTGIFVLLLSTPLSAVDFESYESLALQIYSAVQQPDLKNKPDKIVILYNAYKIVRELAGDVRSLSVSDAYFKKLADNNPAAFRSIALSMYDKPLPIFNPKLRAPQIDQILNKADTFLIPDASKP